MSIAENLKTIQTHVRGVEHPVHLVAISKMQSVEAIREAVAAGQRDFGENYVQELVQKAESLADLNLNWHFVGHLQRNKINMVLPWTSTIHSIDSIKLAEAISKRADRVVAGFIEINIGGETSKSGIFPDALPELLRECSDFDHLQIKGLMCIPPPTDDTEMQKKYFTQVADLQKRANTEGWYKHPLTDLSMGMSDDYRVAIEHGATYLRIGTAIFGERVSA